MDDISATNEVKPFHFPGFSGLTQGVRKKLEEVHAKFAQNLTSFLEDSAKEKIQVTSISSEKLKSGFSFADRDEMRFEFVFTLESGQKGWLIIEKKIATYLLRLLLGYSFDKEICATKLTRIEHGVLSQLTKDILIQLQKAWEGDLKMSDLFREESKVMLPENELALSKILLTSKRTSGELEIVYPLSAVDKARFKGTDLTPLAKEKIKELVEDSEIDLNCILGKVETHSPLHLTLSELADLKAGDVILTDKESETEAILSIQGKSKFKGIPGVFRGKKGMKITTTIF